MFGEKVLELVGELKRARPGTIPPYNEDLTRQVIEEMRVLFEENLTDVSEAASDKEKATPKPELYPSIHLRHVCLERNQRGLLLYNYNRLVKLKDLRWELGSILPDEFRLSLSEQEVQWFQRYNRTLANYMRSVGGGVLDLTEYSQPPKTLHIEVRCLEDYGDLETDNGTVVQLKKGRHYYLLRSQCEQLIRQGILEHIQ